jgi:hypothetical protein
MAGDPGWAWELLDVEVGADARTIKRAYARLLKLNRPDDDAGAFQLLHQAYQAALGYAQYNPDHRAVESHNEPAREVPTRPAAELDMPALMAPSDPQGEAQQAWDDFLAGAGANPRARLHAIASGQALLSFAARDAFEQLALHHCAKAACGDEVRDAVVEHFKWDSDLSHVSRIDTQAAQEVLGRFQAARSHEHFSADIVNNKAIEFLLSDALPSDRSWLHLYGFTRQMRDATAAIRWQHPELLAYRLDADVFAWWEQRAAEKKYFLQTALYSAAAGAIVFAAAWALLFKSAAMQPKWSGTALFFICQSLVFAAVALMVFRPPRRTVDALLRFKHDHLDVLLHERRLSNAWQFGWMAPFAVLTLLLAVPDPGPLLKAGLGVGFFLCAAASVFAGSVFMPLWRFYCVAVLTLINTFAMTSTGFEATGFVPCLFFSVCLFTVAMQYGEHLYAAARLTDMHLTRLRVAWLGAAFALYLAVHSSQWSHMSAAAAALALLICGVMLARMVLNGYLTWAGLVLVKYVIFGQMNIAGFSPHMRYLAPALIVTSFFMIATLIHTQSD